MNRHVGLVVLSLLLAGASLSCGSDSSGGGGGGGDNADGGADLRPINTDLGLPDSGADAGTDAPIFSGEVCDNLVDDDGDTLIDCDDPDCLGATECPGGGNETETICDDGLDDDNDGRFDCNDADCASDPACTTGPTDEICDNEADDDHDGLVDCFDGDCASDAACRATTAEDCFNGIDDDGDNAVDCDDADCERACAGGGGGGGGTDDLVCLLFCGLDPGTAALLGCTCGGGGGGTEDCSNGVDDNGDGAIDCDDLTCLIDPACGF